MGLFKTAKEKMVIEQGKLEGQASDLRNKIDKVQNAMVHVGVELMIDDSATNKKRLAKLEDGLKGFQAELEAVDSKLAEVAGKLSAIYAEEAKEEIDKASEAYGERALKYYRRTLFNRKIETVQHVIENSAGALPQPEELRNIAGLGYGEEFNQLSHGHLLDKKEQADLKAKEQAEKEVDELIERINKLLALNLNK